MHRHPVALRLLRAVHAQLLGLLQYVTLIFGSANHHAPVPPSDNCITTANTIFHLLRVRTRKQQAFVLVSHTVSFLWVLILRKSCSCTVTESRIGQDEGDCG